MRDRLIELLDKGYMQEAYDASFSSIEDVLDMPKGKEYMADYLLKNGVIVPPCKVGDTVYAEVANTIKGFVITNFEFSVTPNGWSCGVTSSNGLYPMLFSFDSVGKTVFLTKEEAEQALKGGEG